MQTEIPIILMSHGRFAEAALECAEMLVGTQQSVATLAIHKESNINEVRQSLLDTYQTLNQGHGVLILVDLMGGSPCNLATELLLTHPNILLYCGINIPTLLEIFTNRELPLNEIASLIDEVFPSSCFNVGLLQQRAIQQEDIQL